MRALISLIALTLTASMAFGVVISKKKGDVNGDGKVDKEDARLIERLITHPGSATPAQKAAADANGDGVIDIRDVRLVLKLAS